MEKSLKAVRSILVVEDDEMLRDALEFWLDEYAEIECAADIHGAEAMALARFKQGGAPYDLFLIDIHLLHGEDGRACLEMLRRIPTYTQVPALAMSGYPATGKLISACEQAGFFALLEKPFLIEEVESALWSQGRMLVSKSAYEPAA